MLRKIKDVILEKSRWVHPRCQLLAIDRNGPFLELPGGRLMTVDSQGMRVSNDDGKTWSEARPVCRGINSGEAASFHILRTRTGTLVIVYLNYIKNKFSWDEKSGEPKKGDCRLELWAIRSLDCGKTWIDRQKLLSGYNANFFGFIQVRGGRLVTTVDHLVSNPGRWVACSLISDDEGKTWKSSNLIDLGGHGHHDGAMEPTVAELSDGRLLMLIRTNLGRFWQAFSEDGGKYWRTIQPSRIDANPAPGYLLKLRSGRLALVWNRLNLTSHHFFPKRKPNAATAETKVDSSISNPFFEVSPPWHREELSIAFSEDDGKIWKRPVVIARQKEGGQLSYPYIFEHRPGELWVTAGFAFKKGWSEPLPLRLKIDEEKWLKK